MVVERWYKKGLVASIIVLFVSISITPLVSSQSIKQYVSISDPYDMDLSCDEPYQDVKQGETATFIVEIKNTGTFNDTYDVIASSIEDIICLVNGVYADQFNPYPISVQAGESETFEVTAEVWESVPIGEWIVIVEACSQNDPEVNDELILTANVQKKNKIKSFGEESSEKDDSRDIKLGFIFCRVCYMKIGEWFQFGLPGEKIECVDLDTGEVVAEGKTRIFGFYLFKFLPLGHDYKITAHYEYGWDSKNVKDLGFFQKVEFVFIIK
jgi:hypothetical protein